MFFKRLLVLHPFLLGIYFAIDNFIPFASYTSIFMLFIAILILGVIVLLFNLSIFLFIKDKIKSGLITTLILIPVLFYCKIQLLFSHITAVLQRAHYIFLIVGSILIYMVWKIIKSRKSLIIFNRFLNELATLYIILGIITILLNLKYYDSSLERKIFSQKFSDPKISLSQMNSLPDIYYLVFDSYTSPKSLKKYWDYEDSNFISHLKKKGFYITENSHALYNNTLVNIASSFNMTNNPQLPFKPEEIKLRLIDDNLVVRYLSTIGYEIINLSFFVVSGTPRFYNHAYDYYKNKDKFFYFRRMFHNTAISQLIMHFHAAYVYKANFRIINLLKKMPLSRQLAPRFIYAHIMMPHSPYYFDRNGKFIPWFKKSTMDKDAYLEQLIFTNQIIIDIVNVILSGSRNPPIIIIQGDHGFRFLKDDEKDIEACTILNVYYLPNGGDKLLYPSVSPFNSFRVIFNYYFNAKYELLVDGAYLCKR